MWNNVHIGPIKDPVRVRKIQLSMFLRALANTRKLESFPKHELLPLTITLKILASSGNSSTIPKSCSSGPNN